ncbi:YlaF family protein [Planococcus sp. APC 3900]|uniref:YlaF family protein n=2 Tax=Planococcus TaxID=1372 RepID=A0ABT7ZFV2_9BACL|nr:MULTISPECIES: YlaF family protein [Planococcus]MBD8013727.1 YlaF family protein [Planococcus wigleyi]MBF6633158.1 YlaF family protein [Planococcus sp. (in: firmicutes)]MDN3426030.1 YlaF family protein [Planococcus sp. APC 4016]MDN3437624.1 YlaF family protein [Planococcus sp. APC 3900]
MKNVKWIFVFYSIAALLAMAGIGLAVGLRSVLGIFAAILVLCLIMGMGFKKKKEMREAGLL